MTKNELKEEFSRWLESDRKGLWVKYPNTKEWLLEHIPTWDNDEAYYITHDKHAEFRKLQIDNPETKFKIKVASLGWVEIHNPTWFLADEYMIDRKFEIGEWVRDISSGCIIQAYEGMKSENFEPWTPRENELVVVWNNNDYVSYTVAPYKGYVGWQKFANEEDWDNILPFEFFQTLKNNLNN